MVLEQAPLCGKAHHLSVQGRGLRRVRPVRHVQMSRRRRRQAAAGPRYSSGFR
jgi:hypothetical protein